ncbi:MAG: L-seryl-tRNA(Sec) selenium transferase, partial [Burkholderiales bacterium]
MADAEGSLVEGSEARRRLPSVDRLLRSESVPALCAAHGATLVAAEARALLAALRDRIAAGGGVPAA